MSQISPLSPVAFHGDTIYCISYHNQPYTAMKPIVENMGLAWQSQLQKLNANKERWGITIIVIPSASGEQQTACMPVRKLPAYLASINPNKVRPELREKIIRYQNECDDVLWNYWTKEPPTESGWYFFRGNIPGYQENNPPVYVDVQKDAVILTRHAPWILSNLIIKYDIEWAGPIQEPVE